MPAAAVPSPSPWRAPLRWWRARSETERVDLYTRWSLYVASATEPVVVLRAVQAADRETDPSGVAVLLLALAHTAACVLLCRSGTDAYLGRRGVPRCAAVSVVLLGAATALAGAALDGPGTPVDPVRAPAALVVVVAAVAYTSAALALVVPLRHLAGALAAGAAGLAVVALWRDAPTARTGPAVVVVALLVFATVTYRFSVWLLGVVHELDDAQRARSSLAVAEERLRIARDLHDVVGRHLSAIAVKSELTAELARRGDGRAPAQALEVRGLAHESLREVRAVVAGYREVDLEVELAGSRALLRSAGIRCRTVGAPAGWPSAVQVALAWAVREATTNVLRHSAAGECSISLGSTADGAALLVVDNDGVPAGAGSPGGERSGRRTDEGGEVGTGGGSGLPGLAERVRALGGRLEAGPRPPDRFVLRVVVPVVAA